ncbi:MAG: hemerythrin domain-containing protein [Acidobacteriota bacterium]
MKSEMTIDSSTTGFLSLMSIHRALDEMFLLHQEALLDMDLPLASSRLREFETALLAHMRNEEELLLPVYARAGRIAGGSREMFTGEHKKMVEFISRFHRRLEEMSDSPADVKRRILGLLFDEAMFRMLMEHHDSREQNILYPMLDKVTTEEEKRDLLARCLESAKTTE